MFFFSFSYNLNQFGEAHAVSAVGVQNPGFKADSVGELLSLSARGSSLDVTI